MLTIAFMDIRNSMTLLPVFLLVHGDFDLYTVTLKVFHLCGGSLTFDCPSECIKVG